MQEKRVDDCWNVDLNRSLSDSWKVSRCLLYKKRNHPQDFCVPEESLTKFSDDFQTRTCVSRSMDQNWYSLSESRETRMEKWEAKTRQCSKTERNILRWSLMIKITKKHSNVRKIGNIHGTSHPAQEDGPYLQHDGACKTWSCVPKDSKVDFWL